MNTKECQKFTKSRMCETEGVNKTDNGRRIVTPSPRPLIQKSSKSLDQFTIWTLQILKDTVVALSPNSPKQTGRDHIPYRRGVFPEPVTPSTQKIPKLTE